MSIRDIYHQGDFNVFCITHKYVFEFPSINNSRGVKINLDTISTENLREIHTYLLNFKPPIMNQVLEIYVNDNLKCHIYAYEHNHYSVQHFLPKLKRNLRMYNLNKLLEI